MALLGISAIRTRTLTASQMIKLRHSTASESFASKWCRLVKRYERRVAEEALTITPIDVIE